jgi:hypothetical protein
MEHRGMAGDGFTVRIDDDLAEELKAVRGRRVVVTRIFHGHERR